MTTWSAAWLGVVQGFTEFLPVSSSAHLILAREFFGWDAGPLALPFDVACHVGTLLAILLFFRTDLVAMFRALPHVFTDRSDPASRRVWLIAVGTLPIVVVGLTLADWLDLHARTPTVAATALLVGAGLLLFIERAGTPVGGEEALSAGGAFTVGVAQACALVPGVSRSGATIAAGMALGLRREAAARFTFLMSIPAITAAAGKEALAVRHLAFGADDATIFAVGALTSAVTGYLTVKYFLRFLVNHRLDVFAWYRAVLAVATFVWLAGR